MIGENPSTSPEYILNQQQMTQMMASAVSRAPTAGGQAAGNISIINVATREQAELTAAQERARGHQAIINEVMTDLSRGEASMISRTLRTLQR